VLATVRTWVSLRTLQEQTIIGSPLAQIPMSASSLKADIHHDDGDDRFVPIVLQKSKIERRQKSRKSCFLGFSLLHVPGTEMIEQGSVPLHKSERLNRR
jgi:hypothetical protein